MKQKLFSVTINDCIVECLASTGGNGGQRKNRRHTAVRITHEPSGAVGFSKDHAHQQPNRELAWRRMAETKQFQVWCRRMAAELITGESIDEAVEREMQPNNIKTEVRNADGKWAVCAIDPL